MTWRLLMAAHLSRAYYHDRILIPRKRVVLPQRGPGDGMGEGKNSRGQLLSCLVPDQNDAHRDGPAGQFERGKMISSRIIGAEF